MSTIKCISSFPISFLSYTHVGGYNPHASDIVFDEDDSILFMSHAHGHVISMINLKTQHISVLAGKRNEPGHIDDIGDKARFYFPCGLTYLRGSKILIVADECNASIRSVSMEGEVGTLSSDKYIEGPCINFSWSHPRDVIEHPDGRLIVSDEKLHAIVSINQDKKNAYLISGGKKGYRDGYTRNALFNSPRGLSISKSGDIYVCDTLNNCIRVINSQNIVSTLTYSNINVLIHNSPEPSIKNPVRIEVINGDVFFTEEEGHYMKIIHKNNVSLMNKRPMILQGFTYFDDNTIIVSDTSLSALRELKFQIPLSKTNEEEKLEDDL